MSYEERLGIRILIDQHTRPLMRTRAKIATMFESGHEFDAAVAYVGKKPYTVNRKRWA